MRTLYEVVAENHQQPVTLPPVTTVQQACSEMRAHHADTVLVTDEIGELIGIFTAGDAVKRVLAAGKSPAELKLAEVMTRDPVTMPPDKTALDALRLMWDGGFRHMPVTRGGKLIGCVTRGDFKGDERACHDQERELWEHMR
jgi:CBS domain-containing protein